MGSFQGLKDVCDSLFTRWSHRAGLRATKHCYRVMVNEFQHPAAAGAAHLKL